VADRANERDESVRSSVNRPLVSVVLPTHLSEPPFIRDAVASVVDQTWTEWELVVVDDGSPDPETLAGLVGADPRVRVVRTAWGGVARARNLGTQNARGDLVAFLDHDDAWYSGHLAATVEALLRNTSAVAAFTAMEVVRGPNREHVRTARIEGTVDRHSVLSGGARPSLNTMVIRRPALDAVGGFDPRLEGADDLDLVYKLVEEGPYAYVDAVTVVYRLHDENWSRDTRGMGITGDQVVRDHLERARRAGDGDTEADLQVARRKARRYHSGAAVADAVGAWRARQFRSAVSLAWWAVRFSPAGVASAARLMWRRRQSRFRRR
jgi:glycosyltransferase involved in cell wall biosynthesis